MRAFLHTHFSAAVLLPGALLLLASLPSCPPAMAGSELRLLVQVVVPPLQQLDAGAAVVAAPVVSCDDLQSGYLELQREIVLTVRSNTPWELSVRSRSEDVEGPGGLPLSWARGEDRFHRAPADWTPVVSGNLPTEEAEVSLRIRIAMDWQREPGPYQPRLEYRLMPMGW